MPGCSVLHPQKDKDILLTLAHRDRLVPELVSWISSLRDSPRIIELDTQLRCIESHRSIEHVASGEVQDSEGVFFNWVVFDVDSVVNAVFELADPHVGQAGVLFRGRGEDEVVCD